MQDRYKSRPIMPKSNPSSVFLLVVWSAYGVEFTDHFCGIGGLLMRRNDEPLQGLQSSCQLRKRGTQACVPDQTNHSDQSKKKSATE